MGQDKEIVFKHGLPYTVSDCGEFLEPIFESEEWVNYLAALEKQKTEWLKGNSIHNNWNGIMEDSECCPDFSCCGYAIWPVEMRQRFLSATVEVQHAMLMGGLSSLNGQQPSVKIYLAGNVPEILVDRAIH